MSSEGCYRVVIVGGGFGGLYAARALRHAPVEVIVLDRRNHHLFQPLLYQVATGGLSGGDIASPIRTILHSQSNVRVILDEAIDFDVGRKRLVTRNHEFPYDALVVAAGSGSDYFGHDDWREIAPSLKTLGDANLIRSRVLAAFELAELETDDDARRELLSFVVVGAGPTGVELAGVLAEISRDTLQGEFRTIQPKDASVQLVDMASRVLPGFPEELSHQAERHLVRLGVRSRTGVEVKGIDARGVTIKSESGDVRIPSRTVLWAAGVRANSLAERLAEATGVSAGDDGRIPVESNCSLPGFPEVFVIGDMAACRNSEGDLLPGLAPVAMQQGAYIGRLIAKRLHGEDSDPFQYVDKGKLATIGRRAAVADFGWLRFGGLLAWLAWLFIHLLYLAGFQNRVLVATQWAFHYFTYNRKARIISEEWPEN